MEQTRIILVGMPRMLREILRGVVSDEPDLVVVDELTCDGTVGDAVDRGRADVVVSSFASLTSEVVSDLLTKHPALRILALRPDGGESTLYALRPHAEMLGEFSPGTLLACIRELRPKPAAAPEDAHEVADRNDRKPRRKKPKAR